MITHDIGRLYWATFKVKGAPLLHRVSTYSFDPPYRWSRAVVLQYWPGRAVEVGWWRNPVNKYEDAVDSLVRAIRGKASWKTQHVLTGGTHEILEQAKRQSLD